MQYEGGPTPTAIIIVWSNGITAVAYYWLTYQLIAFAFNSKVRKSLGCIFDTKVILICKFPTF